MQKPTYQLLKTRPAWNQLTITGSRAFINCFFAFCNENDSDQIFDFSSWSKKAHNCPPIDVLQSHFEHKPKESVLQYQFKTDRGLPLELIHDISAIFPMLKFHLIFRLQWESRDGELIVMAGKIIHLAFRPNQNQPNVLHFHFKEPTSRMDGFVRIVNASLEDREVLISIWSGENRENLLYQQRFIHAKTMFPFSVFDPGNCHFYFESEGVTINGKTHPVQFEVLSPVVS